MPARWMAPCQGQHVGPNTPARCLQANLAGSRLARRAERACPQVDVGSLMTGSIMSLVLACLQSHCTTALRKGWQAAARQEPQAAASQLRRIHTAAGGEAGEEGAPGDEPPPAEPSELRLAGAWPYWMDRGMQENDVHLHSIALLTGKPELC